MNQSLLKFNTNEESPVKSALIAANKNWKEKQIEYSVTISTEIESYSVDTVSLT